MQTAKVPLDAAEAPDNIAKALGLEIGKILGENLADDLEMCLETGIEIQKDPAWMTRKLTSLMWITGNVKPLRKERAAVAARAGTEAAQDAVTTKYMYKHNAELQGTALGAYFPKCVFL